MKVFELIEFLQELNPNAEVRIASAVERQPIVDGIMSVKPGLGAVLLQGYEFAHELKLRAIENGILVKDPTLKVIK
jgi:hypothetical protein